VTHLLDTDHLSILQHRGGVDHAAVLASMSRHAETDVVASVVSFHEQVMGAHARINSAKTQADTVRGYELLFGVIADFRVMPLLPFDGPAVAVFATLTAQKIRISTMDRRIAAVALSRNLVVVTRNARDFGQVPGLRLEDWAR
jgi:tRNA(fMet)-specific endonuclease VapC